MPSLSFASNAFKKDSLEAAIDHIAACGYGGVELMADLHHAYPLTFSASRRRDIAKRLADLGLTVSNVNAFTHFVDGDTYHPTWIEDDQTLVEKRVQHTLRSLEMAAEFGCRTISIQPGGPTIGSQRSRTEHEQRFADALSRCVDRAQSLNVTLGIEPEPGLFIQTADEYLAFKQRHFASIDAVKMNCDIGHLFCVGDDPAAVIESLSDHIIHIHLEDIGGNRVHQHLTPGKGVIDFGRIFDAMKRVNYTGHATVELYPYETTAAGVAKRAIEHLAPIMAGKKMI